MFKYFHPFIHFWTGDRELVEFLQEEIVAEKRNLNIRVPSHVDDFSIKVDNAEVTLTKNFHDEK